MDNTEMTTEVNSSEIVGETLLIKKDEKVMDEVEVSKNLFIHAMSFCAFINIWKTYGITSNNF